MLILFKGELSLTDITRRLTYKDMMSLRDARINHLLKERQAAEQEARMQQQEAIRNKILKP
jgi:hypothetical protein